MNASEEVGALVLSRKVGERIVIDGRIAVEVVQLAGRQVRLCVIAPKGIPVAREELLPPDHPARLRQKGGA